MPKNKRPVPRQSSVEPEDRTEAIAKQLCDMALELAEQEDADSLSKELRQKEVDFHKLVRKTLNQKRDEVLYEAIDRATYEDVDAYRYLRSKIEEESSSLSVRREGAPTMELNAFAIPFFAHSKGGLKEDQEFQDQDAFEALVASFQQGELESAKAKVVLIRHAYDLNEIDAITYCHLSEMLRDAHASMTEKRPPETPALERSISGWSGAEFEADDVAVELRFLLGFALKRADDAFYVEPKQEAEADLWYEARMQRYEAWTKGAAPLLQRCLAPAAAAPEINFLYLDLFHGAKEQGISKQFILQMLSDIDGALEENGLDQGQVKAVVAPGDHSGEIMLRVKLYPLAGGAPLSSSDKPFGLGGDLEDEVDEVCEVLSANGIGALAVAQRFDAQSMPLNEVAYKPR